MSDTDSTASQEPGSNQVLLPVDRAFVVRFSAGSFEEPEPCRGRAEHVQSGSTCTFDSTADLQAFFRASIHEARMKGESEIAR